ncbi:HDIG domain-containing protein [Enterococcus mundtii]|uniref:HD family phosphohydrolase n=1 Tax=Enterococcus TaxID=1350 RepID=UPI00044507A6|nr:MULTISPECIES: HDIG domain-containing metalloprotein [Enterococcus]AZP93229.1 HDIG domain-containing protein [Enterococcus mundtii]EYT96613.1 membrane protein [Enterococcus mundtii CRL35]MDA9430102.1 Membrane protein containing HD superfamily hydrolase [Enterococcus mundtii 1A]MDK4210515.1 HDIG domain-containing protein [Enterococcus mundtii]MDO7879058.1 HDIG domain-containing protein [Enterococcus mundtii]
MLNKILQQLQAKLGKAAAPFLLLLFFLLMCGITFSSVKQKPNDFREGQVAEESIRANKTIENTEETEQKRKLAAEAVTPEYTYQSDLASEQDRRINQLFVLISRANDTIDKQYEEKVSKAKEDENVPKPTVEERIAALKRIFESSNADDVAFYQKLPNSFYSTIMNMSESEITTVRDESLKLIDEQMSKQVRESDLDNFKQEANDKIQYLNVSAEQQEMIRYLVDQGIVVNDVLNEKRTEELKQEARDSIQPVMIFQGEIIVREGNQIDATAMKKLELLGLTSQSTSIFPLVAMILAVLLQIGVLFYNSLQYKDLFKRTEYILFYVTAMSISILLMKFFQVFQTEQATYIPLLYPAAFVPLVLNFFLNRRAGIMAALFQAVSALFIFYNSIGTNFLTVILVSYLFAGFLAAILKRQRISEQWFPAIMWVVVFPLLMDVVLVVYQGMSFSDGTTWLTLVCGFMGAFLSYLLTIGLHPYIELLVNDDSVIVLNELSNPNHPLLKQLLEEAPGTYHHSMMVANLSANAVAEIGGRSLLTRVACYYHDIGKIKHASFFVENLPSGAENPHNFLLPEDSKQIIFGHVTDGAKILEEYDMPQMVIDICKQHHGTTLMRYFYIKAKERNPEVTEEQFRYPGPRPQTREAGIVNIADSCEAAVRAMDHPTSEKIEAFVHNLIEERISDGQLDDSGLTLKEIRKVEKSLVSGLSSTFHSRIKYPKMKSEAEKMKQEKE